MSKLETFHDLKLEALKKAGELTNGSSDYDTIVEEEINRMLRSLFAGGNEFNVDLAEPWEWAKARNPGILTLIPPFSTGTVSLTLASTSGTFSSAPTGLGSLAGQFLQVTSRDTFYRIAAHTADATSFTIDQEYLEATGATLAFKVIKIDYELTSGVERLTKEMRIYKRQQNEDPFGLIQGLPLNEFDRKFPRMLIQSGVPERFAFLREENGLQTVRFSHYPTQDKMRVEYDYIPIAPNQAVKTFTSAGITAGTDLITITNHGFTNEQQVKLTTTLADLPAGLSIETAYFVISATADTFKLSASLNGLAVDITDGGTGTHTISTIPPVPYSFRKVLSFASAHVVLVDKSDSRSDYYGRNTQATLQALVTANRKIKRQVSRDKGRLITRPSQGHYNNRPTVEGF